MIDDSPNVVECDYIDCDERAKWFVTYSLRYCDCDTDSCVKGGYVCGYHSGDYFRDSDWMTFLEQYDIGHVNYTPEDTPTCLE